VATASERSKSGKAPGASLQPLTVSRAFPARPEVVFRAWSTAEHVKRWFSPPPFTVPEATVDFRVGGTFDVLMRGPNGVAHWIRGRITELVPDRRLVIDMQVSDESGPRLFDALTEVSFADHAGGTRLDVVQTYTPHDPSFARMVEGAPQGWAATLDRLGREVGTALDETPAHRSVVLGSFRIERRYPASPARVYRALTDPAAKAKWFAGGEGFTTLLREMDVRVGGREQLKGRWSNGLVTHFDAVYHDLVPGERIIYAYAMSMDARKISVSLATFELFPANGGTRLVMAEQGAFLDGYDDAGSRERGSGLLLDALGAALAAAPGD
jgi:uncharacterized protein YndB with AHSA1/START domain